MTNKEIFIGPYVEGEGRLWCQDNVWLECEQSEVDRYIHESDPRLDDNFETALKALIEHHGVDALTSLAAVMRHHAMAFYSESIVQIESDRKLVFNNSDLTSFLITADDIKPEI